LQKFAKRFEVRAELRLVHLDSVSPALERANLSSDIAHFDMSPQITAAGDPGHEAEFGTGARRGGEIPPRYSTCNLCVRNPSSRPLYESLTNVG
jgi:hypothetical protein